MVQERGFCLPLSPARRFICDMMYFSERLPGIPIQRRMQIDEVVNQRSLLMERPGWCAIFLKAYSIVCARHPEMRRAYMPFPWPHLYEHPINVASVSVERSIHDEIGVLVAHVRLPETQSLLSLDQYLRDVKEKPMEEFGNIRRILRLCRLPLPIRRMVWWWGLHSSGRRRARHMGTFGVSSVAGQGAGLLHVRSPLASTMNYDVIDEQGCVNVRVVFDHRVIDGAFMARLLEEMETVMNVEILQELSDLRRNQRLAS